MPPGNPFDAVIVGYQGDNLLFAGKVRAGFVPHVRREIMARMKPLETDVCPFANLPEKKRRTQWALIAEEIKNCVWLKPELVVQIEFTEGHRTIICGMPRLPSFAKTRMRETW